MSDLSQDVMLWLPTYLVEDKEAVKTVTKANGLIMDFCDLDIGLEQVLDEFSTMKLNPDYLMEDLDFHLRRRGV